MSLPRFRCANLDRSDQTISQTLPSDQTNSQTLPADQTISQTLPSDQTISQTLPSDQTIVRLKKWCDHSATQKTSDQTIVRPKALWLDHRATQSSDQLIVKWAFFLFRARSSQQCVLVLQLVSLSWSWLPLHWLLPLSLKLDNTKQTQPTVSSAYGSHGLQPLWIWHLLLSLASLYS